MEAVVSELHTYTGPCKTLVVLFSKRQKIDNKMIRKPGIEPGASEWESEILPLDYFRDDFIQHAIHYIYNRVYISKHTEGYEVTERKENMLDAHPINSKCLILYSVKVCIEIVPNIVTHWLFL